jgi:hypothetical protein
MLNKLLKNYSQREFVKKLPLLYKYTHNVNGGKACMVFVREQAWNL